MFNSSFLGLLFSDPFAFVIIFGGILLAIGFHEAAHAFMADYLGDPTPRSLGRTTLNPLAHLDPLGTMVILVTGVFGWGKPAPYDPYNLKNPKRDTALIALAGPGSNLVMAVILSLFARFLPLPQVISQILASLISLNITLGLFNLIPVAPLDGSKIAGIFMSNESAARYANQNNLFLLLLLILPIFGGYSVASLIISPVAGFLLKLLLP
jgi:Zn-dependent protease